MENSIYIGLSRQITLERQMNVLANNVANINTPGFKSGNVLFEEYIARPKEMDENMSLVYDYGQFHVEAQGPMKFTGNDLDIALEGPGYMMVETAQGTQYTRAGNFTLNNNGELVTPSGHLVLDDGQKPITIPAGATDITIAHDGQISSSEGLAGRIGIVEFENVQDLDPTGNGFLTTQAQSQPALHTTLRQGMLEGSNVQGVLEMTNLIEISRKYQSINRMLQSEHDRQRTVIQKLTEA